MALANAVQGAKRPSQLITWLDEDGNAVSLSGATITAKIKGRDGVSRTADGVFTVTDAAGGVFRWDYGTNDVATTGTFSVQFSAAFGSTPTPQRSLIAQWQVHDAIE